MDFKADGSMEEKEYPSDCAVGGPNRRPIFVITHDESIFSANDGRRQVWIRDGDAILRPKGKGKGIMVSDFLLLFSIELTLSFRRTPQSIKSFRDTI